MGSFNGCKVDCVKCGSEGLPEFVVKASEKTVLAQVIAEIEGAGESLFNAVRDELRNRASTLAKQDADAESVASVSTCASLCHDNSWHGWYCHQCGQTVPQDSDEVATVNVKVLEAVRRYNLEAPDNWKIPMPK